MKHTIREGIHRLSLHDSHVQSLALDGERLSIVVDWAKLVDFPGGSGEGTVVMGKTRIVFEGYEEESMRLDYGGIPGKEDREAVRIAGDFDRLSSWLILENKVMGEGRYRLSGLYEHEGNDAWLDWSFGYTGFEVAWEGHISMEDWQNGVAVPE